MRQDIELFMTNDAAKWLGCSAEKIRALANAGKLPCLKTVGGVRLFTRPALEREAAKPKRTRGRTQGAQV